MTAERPDVGGIVELERLDGIDLRAGAPLAPLTTWKIGGPARWLIEVSLEPALVSALAALDAHRIRWAVLGNGSNVLISDRGFDGAVIKLGGRLAEIHLQRGDREHRVVAGGGASLTRLLRLAKEERLAGLWVLGGVPGTIGGAVKMNAGTRWGEVSDTLESARLASASGLRTITADELDLGYRRSNVAAGTIVAGATFRVGDASEAMRDKLDEVLAYRKASQPLQLPSCGSVFANPEGDSAGRLIEAVGLKGHGIGGLEISERHANWIVNRGGGSAADALALIALCQERVRAQFGIELRPEVQRFGDFEEAAS